jgi:hypothetical protein
MKQLSTYINLKLKTMKKIILISTLIFLLIPFVMAERPADVTSLEKTTHLLAVAVFEKFSYFPLATMAKATENMQDLEKYVKYEEVSSVMLTFDQQRKSCWQCACKVCTWKGRVYPCSYPGYGDAC